MFLLLFKFFKNGYGKFDILLLEIILLKVVFILVFFFIIN